MSKNRHGNGRFAPGQDLGPYRGAARHDPSTEAIKTSLHSDMNTSRRVVVPHAATASVGTDGGARPQVHPCDDCDNSGINARTNTAMQRAGSPRLTSDPGQLAGAGVFKSN